MHYTSEKKCSFLVICTAVTSLVQALNMAHTIRCSCSNLQSSPINELNLIADKSKALMDLYRSLVFKGCDKIDNSLLDYIKYYQLKFDKFCVVTIPKPCVEGAQESAGYEVRSFDTSSLQNAK
jgi:hypothetical protein